MIKRLLLTWIICCLLPVTYAAEIGLDGLGQTIQINTRLHSFIGKPSWLIVIRDIDNDQNVPHVFDITSGENSWLIFTFGHNYLITISEMQISSFRSHYDDYDAFKIHDFCHLESNGHIMRGESMYINISGDLTKNGDGINCQVTHYKDANFSVAVPSGS